MSEPARLRDAPPRLACGECGTELAPDAVSCPACRALVHAERLRGLAARAEELESAGQQEEARGVWAEALALLPPDSRQHTAIAHRVSLLDAALPTATTTPDAGSEARIGSRKGFVAAAAGIGLLLAGKLKFLVIGLTKAKTFVSMFAFFGVYWSTFGWPLALGLVISIYIHEMGHVAALRRLNIAASAPLFIPGLGAIVRLKQHITDPKLDAAVGLAGPVWGLTAGLVAFAVHLATDSMIWLAIAQLTGWINLFNLIPIWQLDGARGFHALSTAERFLTIMALAVAFAVTGEKLLLLVGAVGIWQVLRAKPGPGDPRALATFIVLIALLSWMSALRAV